MATETKEKKVVETEEENKIEEKKENETMSEETKNEEKGTVKESKKEKEGFFKRTWKGIKRHKREIFACAGGILAGVGGTLGVEKLGEMYSTKKNAAQNNNYIESGYNDDETLSPNE